MRDEVADEVGQNSEERQTRDPVSGEDPEIAAFKRMGLGTGGWRYCRRSAFGGPRIHANLPVRSRPDEAAIFGFPHTCQTRTGSTEDGFYYGFGGKLVKFLLADLG